MSIIFYKVYIYICDKCISYNVHIIASIEYNILLLSVVVLKYGKNDWHNRL